MNDITYNISEHFISIQGEGNFCGVRSLFIRFQFCNLTCSWCDTKYTWNKYSGNHKQFAVSEVNDLIRENNSGHVIFTGGEPSLYRLDMLTSEKRKYHVETNGTIIPTQPLNMTLPDGSVFTREAMDEEIISLFNWVISPKLSNSRQKINSQSIEYWAEKKWGIFKFIAKTVADIEEINTFIENFSIDKNRVYIGIEGTSRESQLKPELADEIILNGYNYSPRLHVLLWGDVRGK
jgi:organic radical activating enzyme